MSHDPSPNPNAHDDPSALPVLTVGIASVLLVVALVFVLTGLYQNTQTKMQQVANSGESQQVQQLAADQKARLNTPGWIDRKAGVVRLPIDEAIKLVAKELPESADGTGPWSPLPGAASAPASQASAGGDGQTAASKP